MVKVIHDPALENDTVSICLSTMCVSNVEYEVQVNSKTRPTSHRRITKSCLSSQGATTGEQSIISGAGSKSVKNKSFSRVDPSDLNLFRTKQIVWRRITTDWKWEHQVWLGEKVSSRYFTLCVWERREPSTIGVMNCQGSEAKKGIQYFQSDEKEVHWECLRRYTLKTRG